MRYRAVIYSLLGLLTAGVVAAVIFPIFAKAKLGGGPGCFGNIHQLANVMLMYSADNDGLPPADAWMDDLSPYVHHSDRIFHCPEVYRDNRYEYGYAMQTRLEGKNARDLESPAKESMVFDSFPIGRNAHTNHPLIPGFSRHDGQNIGYADGHAAHLKNH